MAILSKDWHIDSSVEVADWIDLHSILGKYGILTDCIKDDPQMQKELDKSQIQLLKEELKLQEEVNKEAQQRAELAYLDAKKISSQYQKEAEKCNTVGAFSPLFSVSPFFT